MAVLVAVLAGLAVAPALRAVPASPGVGMDGQGVGTCHDIVTVEEYYAVSDSRPPVSCRRRHVSETITVARLPVRWSQQTTRPTVEQLRLLRRRLPCGFRQVKAYVGSSSVEPHWFLTTIVRFPTAAAWSAGERRYRCEVVPQLLDGSGRPTRTGSLRRIMRRPASAAIRPCLQGSDLVTCERPHDGEIVGSEGPNRVDDPAARARFEAARCPLGAERFLGRDPAGLGLSVEVTDLVPGHTYCVVRFPGGATRTGTLAARARGAS